MNAEPLTFGLVGCGRISGKHIDALQEHSGSATITDVCDIDADALARAVKTTGATGHACLADLLANGSCDTVVLCTPSGLHPWQAIECAGAGKNVVTEKPMATRWQDGLAMVRACDKAGVRLFVVKQNRKNATLQLLKRAIDEGRFGRIFMVNVNVFWTRSQEYYDSADWRGTWEIDGGAFMNQASHYVDLLDWLIGPVANVNAMTATLQRNIQVEDTGVLNVRWRSGALGSMNVTMLTYPKNLEGSITILGEKGSARVGGVAVNEIQHWDFADERDYDAKIADSSYAIDSVYGFGHPAYYENVIATLRGEADAETDGREGLKSLELLIATYISARDGRTVSLPLEY